MEYDLMSLSWMTVLFSFDEEDKYITRIPENKFTLNSNERLICNENRLNIPSEMVQNLFGISNPRGVCMSGYLNSNYSEKFIQLKNRVCFTLYTSPLLKRIADGASVKRELIRNVNIISPFSFINNKFIIV